MDASLFVTSEPATCLYCNRPVRGRADKKFCNDHCRNLYHNHRKTSGNSCVREISRTLMSNRRILESLLAAQHRIVRTSRKKLCEQGFDFGYFTHQLRNGKGQRYSFCYEFGYRVEKEVVTVTRKFKH